MEPSSRAGDQHQSYTPSYSPPIGLHGMSQEELRQVCLKHIKSVVKQERHAGEVKHGDISSISWMAFEAVDRYRKSSPGNENVSHSSWYMYVYALTEIIRVLS
jgi:hypothetical protein